MNRLIIPLFIIIFFESCSPSVYRTYKKEDNEDANTCGLVLVRIHPPDSIVDKVGEILIDDIGTSIDCSEEKTINYIKKEACSVGAQVVLIKEIKRPDNESYCYRCTAVLYKYKPGAKPIKQNKYYDTIKIKKREQRDRKKKISRTINILDTIHHIIHLFIFHDHEHDHI
jgi:hypothetical protein